MILLFGPCMFLAPLLVVLIPVAIVLWPPVLATVGLLWLIVWPFAAIGGRFGVTGIARVHAALGRWFVVLLRPWNYFNAPPAAAKTEGPTAPATGAGGQPPPGAPKS
jgi:hypothetical protein